MRDTIAEPPSTDTRSRQVYSPGDFCRSIEQAGPGAAADETHDCAPVEVIENMSYTPGYTPDSLVKVRFLGRESDRVAQICSISEDTSGWGPEHQDQIRGCSTSFAVTSSCGRLVWIDRPM